MFESLGSLLAQDEWNGSFFFPEQASTFAKEVDWLYDVILWVSTFFFVVIVGAMVLFVIRYRKRPGYVQQPSTSHNMMLEVSWSVLPSLILVFFFVKGVWGFLDLRTPPDGAREITVIAQKWSWGFRYENGEESDELHMPKDVPVKFTLESRDVLHSFFIPAFRQKWDVVPGRYGKTWATATMTGRFRVYCAEYCGKSHSEMKTWVTVHDLDWDAMMKKIEWKDQEHTAVENGERYYRVKGCNGCHSTDGTTKVGPTFLGVFGTSQETDAGTVTVDEEYLRESMLEPGKKLRTVFRDQMPRNLNLSEDQISYLIAYIKSLKE